MTLARLLPKPVKVSRVHMGKSLPAVLGKRGLICADSWSTMIASASDGWLDDNGQWKKCSPHPSPTNDPDPCMYAYRKEHVESPCLDARREMPQPKQKHPTW
ncbi:ER membrane protein complex subunit 8 [Platysternon megacephalum]|uniref:ER membrane protein complex subunit 8 n=1 Tax=Platysternon megacephalum TaxID=55544 RepID=A0A4D9EDZ3_9SAUR|nr:ER membrane protein complex subunit 8 [Platysternon megacephalum]